MESVPVVAQLSVGQSPMESRKLVAPPVPAAVSPWWKRAVFQFLAVALLDGLEPFLVGHGDPAALAAPDRDRLELLGAHDRAHPGAGGDAALLVDDAGQKGQLLAGRPDAGDGPGAGIAQLLLEGVLGLVGVEAPQIVRPGRCCAWPWSMTMQTGLDAAPVTNSPSYPANFSSGPQVPPELESAQAPVSGDLQATV